MLVQVYMMSRRPTRRGGRHSAGSSVARGSHRVSEALGRTSTSVHTDALDVAINQVITTGVVDGENLSGHQRTPSGIISQPLPV